MAGSKFSGFRENLWICRKHSTVRISTHRPSLLTVTAHLHGRGKKSTFAFTRNPHLHLQEIHICIYKKCTFVFSRNSYLYLQEIHIYIYEKSPFAFTLNRTHLHPSIFVIGSRGAAFTAFMDRFSPGFLFDWSSRKYFVGRSTFYQSPMFYFIRALKIDIKGRKKGMG